jgi:DNA repair protein RadA/Sms
VSTISSKVKTSFFCQNCGVSSPKWVGHCSSCGQWNTYVEEIISKQEDTPLWKKPADKKSKTPQPHLLSDVAVHDEQRIILPDKELNRVLGEGLVPGSLVLMGGEPGIGKSTLMLQVSLLLKNKTVLYISGEESEQQIKMRAERLKLVNEKFFILTDTSLDNIFRQISEINPEIVVVDSIQRLEVYLKYVNAPLNFFVSPKNPVCLYFSSDILQKTEPLQVPKYSNIW